jgi:hypothetical protein
MSKRLIPVLLAVVALIGLSRPAFAQEPVTFGIKAGIVNSTLNVNDGDGFEVDSLWGAAAGAFAVKNMTELLGLQVEALFVQKGAHDDTLDLDTKLRLTYLDVPVTVRIGRTTTDAGHFHVFTGPQVGFKINAEGQNDMFGDLDLDDEVKSVDFGWTLGVGYERGPFSVDARYTMGLTDIDASESDGPAKNRAAMLLLGYRFR